MSAAAATVARRSLRQRTASLLGTVAAVVVVMVAAVVVVVAVATRLSAAQEYTAFGHPILIVASGSMSPTIRTGDLIFEDGISAEQARHLHVGQIVTFADPPGSRRTITHRIVKIVRRGGRLYYITKGDANPAPDAPWRPASAAIGLYVGKIPRGGYFLSNLHRPLVLALLLAAPLLWLVGEPLRRWAREDDDEPDDDSHGKREVDMR